MQVHRFPVWIVSGIERPSVAIEFVAEDEVILLTVRTDAGHCIGRGIIIDHRREIRQLIDLTSTVGRVEPISIPRLIGNGINDRICSEQGQDSATQGEEY